MENEAYAQARYTVKHFSWRLWRTRKTPRDEAQTEQREIEDQLGRFEELLQGNVPRARQVLKKLLTKEVTFAPICLENGKRSFEFRGELSYGAILREVVSMHKIPLGK